MYKAVLIEKGQGGWGGPLVIKPTEEKVYIMSVTGGGIHPVAQKIADLTGGIALDGFLSSAPDSEVACVVVDCGGTARCGGCSGNAAAGVAFLSSGRIPEARKAGVCARR